MSGPFFTLAEWRVRDGSNDGFVEAWHELGRVFSSLPRPPSGTGTLIQSLDDPQLYYSFGAWPDLESIQAMREDPGAREAIDAVVAQCTRATPGGYRVVAQVDASTLKPEE